MGRDKALLTVDGRTLLEQACTAIQSAGLPCLVVGRTQPADWQLADVRFTPDQQSGLGPLGGLMTAFATCPGHAVLLVPCDIPHFPAQALSELHERWLSCTAPALATRHQDQVEPLCAIYGQACATVAQQLIAKGGGSMRALLANCQAEIIDMPKQWAPLTNDVDTPEDFKRLT